MHSDNVETVVLLNASAFCFRLSACHSVSWKVVLNVFRETGWSVDQAKFSMVPRDLIG